MAFLQKKKDIYYVCEKYKVDSKWKVRWIKLGAINRVEAKQVLLRYENDLTYLRLGIYQSHSPLTLGELSKEFTEHQKKFANKKLSTILKEESILKVFCEKFGNVKISDLNPESVSEWFKEKKYKPKTILIITGILRLLYKYAVEKKYVKENPISKIIRPKFISAPPRFANLEDIDKIISVMTEEARAPYEIMLYTGLRPSECLRLQPKNIDFEKNLIDVYPDQTKTAERGILPIHPSLAPVFKRLVKGKKPDDWLFPSHIGSGHQQSLKMALRRACVRATEKAKEEARKKKIKDWDSIKIKVTPYQFRHTFATRVLEKTGDIRTVQQLMRHKNISMTTRYATALEYKLREAVNMI